MADKKKILFVNDEMEMGGVARVLNTLMASLDPERYEVDCMILHKTGLLLEEIPANVTVLQGSSFFQTVDQSMDQLLEKRDFKGLCSKLRLIFYMKTGLIRKKIMKERAKTIHKVYDTEVAAKEGFCTIYTAFGNSRRKINWVLTDYSVCNYSANHMRLVKEALSHIDLNIADSQKALEAYEEVFQLKQPGLALHNLMDVDRIKKEAQAPTETLASGLNIVTVARFHPQKAIERLIEASHTCEEKGLNHDLWLIGGGETEEACQALVQKYHMEHVHFLGYQKNPYGFIAQADLFVLSSLYEGFATVISESLIASTPVLTTAVSGAEEQITSPDYGWIVANNQEALNAGLEKALSNLQRLAEMKQNLQNYTYPNDRLLQEFESVL